MAKTLLPKADMDLIPGQGTRILATGMARKKKKEITGKQPLLTQNSSWKLL